MSNKFLNLIIIFCFILTSLGPIPRAQAQSPLLYLPAPSQMMSLSAPLHPVMLQGLRYDPQKPFQFEFILQQGDHALPLDQLRDQGMDLVRYFMAAMTIPEKELWVNLSPYEKTRIIPSDLGVTRLGSGMLAQDYILKQLASSLTFPDSKTGADFWQRIYNQTEILFGRTDVPVSTFNKVWIVPDSAEVLIKNNTVVIADSHLKVMMEQDYLAQKKTSCGLSCLPVVGIENQDKGQNLASNVMREVIIPILEKEVNTGSHFAALRQMFHAVVLAEWYKRNFKKSLFNQYYANQHKVNGINEVDEQAKETIYKQYITAYKKGVYNFIREDAVPGTGEIIPRKYFSGGLNLDVSPAQISERLDFASLTPEGQNKLEDPNHSSYLMYVGVSPANDKALIADAKIWINKQKPRNDRNLVALMKRARSLLFGRIKRTPLVRLAGLSQMTGKTVYLKDESKQLTGSFKIRGVLFEVEMAVERRFEEVKMNPELAKQPFYIVTQTDGNHGIAMIHAVNLVKKKYRQDKPNKYKKYNIDQKAFVDSIRPAVFTISGLPQIKIVRMREELALYDSEEGVNAQGILDNSYDNYAAAREARENFIREHEGNAEYMEHGGMDIMAGHATAGMEIAEQLREVGIDDNRRTVVIIPVGAGGPVGIAAGVKWYRPNTTVIFVQSEPYSALIRSLQSGKIEQNENNPPPTKIINGVPVVFEDGIAVDEPEKDGVELAKKSAEAGVIVDATLSLEKAAPLIYVDLQSAGQEFPVVGGTTAITAQALLDFNQLEFIRDAQVIVLFGTEGNVDPVVTEHIKMLSGENERKEELRNIIDETNGELNEVLRRIDPTGQTPPKDILRRIVHLGLSDHLLDAQKRGLRIMKDKIFEDAELRHIAQDLEPSIDQVLYAAGDPIILTRTFYRIMDGETVAETVERLKAFKKYTIENVQKWRSDLLAAIGNMTNASVSGSPENQLYLLLQKRIELLDDKPTNSAMVADAAVVATNGGIDFDASHMLIDQQGEADFQDQEMPSNGAEWHYARGFRPIFLSLQPVNVPILMGASKF